MKLCWYLNALRTGDWEKYEKKKIVWQRLKEHWNRKWKERMRERRLIIDKLEELNIFYGSKEDYEKEVGYEVEIIKTPYPTVTYYRQRAGRGGPVYHMRGIERNLVKEGIEALVFAREIQLEGFAGLYPIEWEGVPVRKKE